MDKFYRWLLSTSWTDRLRAYAFIEKDLRAQAKWVLDDDKWEELKLLTGQIISIHFKRYPAKNIIEFTERLKDLYIMLLDKLGNDKSPGHCMSMKLLMDIYDDDDIAARQDIRNIFGRRAYDEERSVLENLFHCYQAMMDAVQNRYVNMMA
ncbi:hypothetical protein SAMN02910356_00262 [Selenomonas sp. GACV-9]|uniref:hypothetical protein n=1 Tax=Selenomonas sp. GACV-9 TaxID=3158782 RepID=UPI0008F31156|nr:hypothetical protein SAMN02910356_00262 [Selenomonas ruminantium]